MLESGYCFRVPSSLWFNALVVGCEAHPFVVHLARVGSVVMFGFWPSSIGLDASRRSCLSDFGFCFVCCTVSGCIDLYLFVAVSVGQPMLS